MVQKKVVKMKSIQSLLTALLVAVAILSGCKAGSRSVSSEITGKTWELVRLMGNDVDMKNYPSGAPTISFDSGGGISGNTGCNSYNGNYELMEDSIELDLGSMTKMFCDGPGEMNFVFAINEVTRVKVDERGLNLYYGSKEVLGFRAK